MLWLAVALTVLSAAGNNIGKVLQKQATRSLPKLQAKPDIVLQYVSSRLWLAGAMLDVVGGLLMVAAFSMAPVSILQPVSGIGLPILLIFSHFYLKERLQRHEWAATGMTGAGILFLGLGSDSSGMTQLQPALLRTIATFLFMQVMLYTEVWWRHGGNGRPAGGSKYTAPQGQPSNTSQTDALMCGLEAGVCFGFSGASFRWVRNA